LGAHLKKRPETRHRGGKAREKRIRKNAKTPWGKGKTIVAIPHAPTVIRQTSEKKRKKGKRGGLGKPSVRGRGEKFN